MVEHRSCTQKLQFVLQNNTFLYQNEYEKCDYIISNYLILRAMNDIFHIQTNVICEDAKKNACNLF